MLPRGNMRMQPIRTDKYGKNLEKNAAYSSMDTQTGTIFMTLPDGSRKAFDRKLNETDQQFDKRIRDYLKSKNIKLVYDGQMDHRWKQNVSDEKRTLF